MTNKHLVIIGASAGGPRILQEIFQGMPRLKTPVILVQHMPAFINLSVCEHLDDVTDMQVKMAEKNESIENGRMYVAPSEKHLYLLENERIILKNTNRVNYVCPSIDVTMLSLNEDQDIQFHGIVLTGMGRDGADGLAYVKSINGITMAQDEDTSIIFGMPHEAIKMGCVDFILNPEEIQQKLIANIGTM